MAKALAAARSGIRRFFSISAFTPPPAPAPLPKADPSPNLFVSGLSKRTTSEGLREAFSKFGEIIQAKVVTDRVSGYSKGFGFVRYASVEEANEGIKGMDGKFLDGWVIFAEYARPRPPPSQDQPSQPQTNFGYAPPSNYSSPAYYTSDTASNFSSQASQPGQPPSSNSYQNLQPPSSYYGGSLPPSNYSSQSSQPSPNYASGYLNYSPQTSQPPPNNGSVPPINHSSEAYPPNFIHSSQTSQPLPNNGSVPPFNHSSELSSSNYNYYPRTSNPTPSNNSVPQSNYSSEISPPTLNSLPSWYPSQTTQPASNTPGAPNYTQSYYGSAPTSNQFSRDSQQTYNYSPQASNPASGYTSGTPNHSPSRVDIPPGDASPRNLETFNNSEPLSEYDSGRAAASY